MRIENLREGHSGDTHRLTATVVWEERQRDPDEIFFEVEADSSYLIPENMHPFIVTAVAPALRHGERRIQVDGAVCPWLKQNLYTAMAYLIDWYWYDWGRPENDRWLPVIEADDRPSDCQPGQPRRTAAFFSGGVDSLELIRRNRLKIPRDHPMSIRDAIFVHGFDIGAHPAVGEEQAYFNYVIETMKPVLDETGLNLIPALTNVRWLEPNTDFWRTAYQGLAMAAIAHVLGGKVTDVLFASSLDVPNLLPWGNHPELDPHGGGFDMRVHHMDERVSRVEKVKLIGDWPVALQAVRVCFWRPEGRLNCGACDKCMHTMLELLCAGKLGDAQTFPHDDLTPAMLKATDFDIRRDNIGDIYISLLKELRRVGRTDLAAVLSREMWKYRIKWALNPRENVKRLDRTILGARIRDFVG